MKKLSLAVCLLIFIQTIFADSLNDKELDLLIQSKINGISPGIAVGVVSNGQIIYEKYFGYANLSDQIKVSSQSKFNIASNAKQYTALAILSLVLQDKLHLEDDFRTYLTDFYPHIKEKITVQQLINHTSGVRDYSDLLSLQGAPWWKRVGLDNTDVLNLIKAQKDLNFKPGTEYMYSNSGYIILTALVSKISGMSFQLFTNKLFENLGMLDTQFNNNYMAVINKQALPYNNWGDGQWQQYPMVVDLNGDGFLMTTLKDQLIWEKTIQQNNHNQSIIAMSQDKLKNTSFLNYGFGVEFKTYKGKQILEHAGSTGSYNAHFIRFPNEKLSLVIMSNNGNVSSSGLAREIADLIVKFNVSEKHKIMPKNIQSKPKIEDITGMYQLNEFDGSSTVISIAERSGKLFRQIQNLDDIQLIHLKGNVYQYETINELKIAFVKNDKGVYDFELYSSGTEMRLANRLDNKPIFPGYAYSIEGNYYSDELDLNFTISHIDELDFAIKIDGKVIKSSLISYDFIKFKRYSLRFIRNETNQVQEVLISYNRIKNLRFHRK